MGNAISQKKGKNEKVPEKTREITCNREETDCGEGLKKEKEECEKRGGGTSSGRRNLKERKN